MVQYNETEQCVDNLVSLRSHAHLATGILYVIMSCHRTLYPSWMPDPFTSRCKHTCMKSIHYCATPNPIANNIYISPMLDGKHGDRELAAVLGARRRKSSLFSLRFSCLMDITNPCAMHKK